MFKIKAALITAGFQNPRVLCSLSERSRMNRTERIVGKNSPFIIFVWLKVMFQIHLASEHSEQYILDFYVQCLLFFQNYYSIPFFFNADYLLN